MGSEDHRLHLQFIQNAITRFSQNSFLLKGWSVAVISTLLTSSSETAPVVAFLPLAAFWLIDGFFLHQERMYRLLYERVRLASKEVVDYGMSTAKLSGFSRYLWSLLSPTQLCFHGALLAAVIVAFEKPNYRSLLEAIRLF